MQMKFLKEVVSIVVGKNAEGIVDLLFNKSNVSEFLIAKKLDLTVNQTRNILYKLSDSGLVTSTRKKDKKKGWYTYFWSIDNIKSLSYYENIIQKKISDLRSQIKSRESKLYYFCPKCHVEYNEENALLHNFTCNECGSVFELKDNTKELKELSKQLTALEKEVSLVREEIQKEQSKIDGKRGRERVKEEKEKALKRKAARAKSSKLRNAIKGKIKGVKSKKVKKAGKPKNKKKIPKKKAKSSQKPKSKKNKSKKR